MTGRGPLPETVAFMGRTLRCCLKGETDYDSLQSSVLFQASHTTGKERATNGRESGVRIEVPVHPLRLANPMDVAPTPRHWRRQATVRGP